MIDVIIPAYNAHNTIKKTLSSIALQLNKEELVVTIVNDGGKDYKEIIDIFKPLLEINEIGYEENRGPGYARQYGIDHTKEEFITFIDADDTFYGSIATGSLVAPLKETETKFVISPFLQLGPAIGLQAPVQPNLIWVFGHMYRRSFIEEHNIRFTPTRANEDVGFNCMCNLIAQHEMGEEGGKVLNLITYEWQHNQVSITRRGNSEYENGICTPGYIYNLHHAYDVAQREGVPLDIIAPSAIETAFSCFFYYNAALVHKAPEETLKGIEELSRKFYYDYFKQSKELIDEEAYNQMYTASYNSKGNHLQGVILQLTLDQFIDLMFSKEVDESTYEQLETNIQTVAEKL